MKKVFLFVATVLATAAMAQEVTLSKLMTQPMLLSQSNLFTSSLDDIAAEWQCDVTNADDGSRKVMYKDISSAKRHRTDCNQTYKNGTIDDVVVTSYKDGTRLVTIMFNFEQTPEVKAPAISQALKNDIKAQIGVKMPGGEVSRQFKKLPSPFILLAVVYSDENFLMFTYKFTEGKSFF